MMLTDLRRLSVSFCSKHQAQIWEYAIAAQETSTRRVTLLINQDAFKYAVQASMGSLQHECKAAALNQL